jgi:hypothetical protein
MENGSCDSTWWWISHLYLKFEDSSVFIQYSHSPHTRVADHGRKSIIDHFSLYLPLAQTCCLINQCCHKLCRVNNQACLLALFTFLFFFDTQQPHVWYTKPLSRFSSIFRLMVYPLFNMKNRDSNTPSRCFRFFASSIFLRHLPPTTTSNGTFLIFCRTR